MATWKHTLSIIALCCSTLICLAGTSDEVIKTAEDLLEQGEPRKALKMLSKHLDTDPENKELLNKRAEILIFIQREKDAKKDINKVIAMDANNVGALLNLARMNYRLDRPDSAIYYSNLALEFESMPEALEDIYNVKGLAYIAQSDYIAAERTLLRAIENGTPNFETLRNLSKALTENERYEMALYVVEESMELYGRNLETLINAGYIATMVGKHKDSERYLNEALEIDQHNPYALANLAQNYTRTGGYTLALETIEKSIHNDNTNAFAYKIKGDCLLQLGEAERACKEYRRAISSGYAVLFGDSEINRLITYSCGSR